MSLGVDELVLLSYSTLDMGRDLFMLWSCPFPMLARLYASHPPHHLWT